MEPGCGLEIQQCSGGKVTPKGLGSEIRNI